LGIGGDNDLLVLLPHLATGIERDGHVALLPWGDTALGIVCHGATTTGMAARYHQVGIALVGEMETIRDALALGNAAKVVKVAVKNQLGDTDRLVVALGGVGVFDEVDIEFGRTGA